MRVELLHRHKRGTMISENFANILVQSDETIRQWRRSIDATNTGIHKRQLGAAETEQRVPGDLKPRINATYDRFHA